MPRRIVRYAFTQGSIEYVESTAKTTHVLAFTNTVLENGVQRVEQPTVRFIQRFVVNEVSGAGAEVAPRFRTSIGGRPSSFPTARSESVRSGRSLRASGPPA
jgi:hypothetical protein